MINIFDNKFAVKITSPFGRRDAPTAGASTNHKGADVVLKNDNVPAVAGGTVSAAGYDGSRGNYVTVKDASGTSYTYMHLANLPAYRTGDTVQEGATIGRQGSTGLSTGKHLHLSIKRNGEYIDPVSYLAGGGTTAPAQGEEATAEAPARSGGFGQVFAGGFFNGLVTLILCAFVAFLAYKFFFAAFGSTQAVKIVKEES